MTGRRIGETPADDQRCVCGLDDWMERSDAWWRRAVAEGKVEYSRVEERTETKLSSFLTQPPGLSFSGLGRRVRGRAGAAHLRDLQNKSRKKLGGAGARMDVMNP